jgi:hypothetical protein
MNGEGTDKIVKFDFNRYVWPITDCFRPTLCILGTGIEAKEELFRIKNLHTLSSSKTTIKSITCHSEKIPEIAR